MKYIKLFIVNYLWKFTIFALESEAAKHNRV